MQTRPLHGNNVRAAGPLRRRQTNTEQLLWNELRGSKLNGLKFRRQHPIARFVIDFYCADVGLAVEIDGGVHIEELQRLTDAERQELLETHGIRFLRIPATDGAASFQKFLNASRQPARTPPLREPAEEGAGG